MHAEPSEELLHIEGYGFQSCTVCVILVQEGHNPVIDFNYPLVCDGYHVEVDRPFVLTKESIIVAKA